MASNTLPSSDSSNNYISKALENELVLLQISSYLTASQLKIIRQVSRIWNRVFVTSMRKKCAAILLTKQPAVVGNQLKESIVQKYQRVNQLENDPNANSDLTANQCLATLTSLIRNSLDGFPCAKFEIGTMLSATSEEDKLLEEFLQEISTFATELTIKKAQHQSLFCQNPMKDFHFTKLKSLTFEVQVGGKEPLHDQPKLQQDLKFFTNIMLNAPKLDSLELIGFLISSPFTAILNSIDNPKVANIKHLGLHGFIENQHIQKLTEMKLKLEKLAITVDIRSNFLQKDFYNFLKSQSESLKELCLVDGAPKTSVSVTFPKMKKLQILKLEMLDEMGVPKLSGINYPDVSFVKSFPNLKHFALVGNPIHLNTFFSLEMQPLESVESLELPLKLITGPQSTKDKIKEVARIFPNLKKIKMIGHKDIVLEVAKHISNLEELTLVGSGESGKDIIPVLTGYSIRELEEADGAINEKEIKGPLTLFLNLKVLRLEHSYVTDLICPEGLLIPQSLQCLDLSRNSDFTEISAEILAKTRQKFMVLFNEECVIDYGIS